MSVTKPAQATPPTRSATPPAASAIDRLRHAAGPAALAVGSVLTVAGMALHVAGDGGPADAAFIRSVEAHTAQWLASHVLLGFGMALIAGGAATVCRLARGRGATLTAIGAATTSVGAALMALGDLAHGAVSYALAGHVDAAASLAIQEAYFTNPVIAVMSFGGMVMPLGVVLLGVALLRSHRVPRWAAIVLLVSPIVISLGFASGARMLVLGLPFLVGMGALARETARS